MPRMKNRPLWVFVTVIVLSAVALLLMDWQTSSTKPKPEVVIQDGKTIDFSSGRAVVRDSSKEKALIEKSVKDMEEASKGVTFTSPKPAPVPVKKAETKK